MLDVENASLELSFLGPDNDFDDHMLLHMLGDVFGKNSGLEGMWPGNNLRVRLALFEDIKEKLAVPFIADTEQAEPCGKIAEIPKTSYFGKIPHPDISALYLQDIVRDLTTAIELTEDYYNSSLNAAQFALKIRDKLEFLKPNQYLFFIGGWHGHAVTLQILKQSDQNFTFRAYNL